MEKYNWSLEKIYKNVDEAKAEIKLFYEFVEKLTREEKSVLDSKTYERKLALNEALTVDLALANNRTAKQTNVRS